MEGYYDYAPRLQLEQHVLLTGFIATETRSIGYRLAALNGLPFADLDRMIEHQAGMSIWKLVWTQGERHYRFLERECLRRELDARPFGILTLGDGALIDDELGQEARARAAVVALELDLPNCYWRLKSLPQADSDFWHPLHVGPLEKIDQVRPFFAERQKGFAQATQRIRMQGRRLSDVVELVQELLPRPHPVA